MKPVSPHDPLDDLIAAALYGDLTPEERTHFDLRLKNDPAARAAYQEAQLMHDLLEKTHRSAQPDPAFEQRMVSGVRRKIQDKERPRETAWESVLVLWRALTKFPRRFRWVEVTVVLGIIAVMAGVALGPITSGIKKAQKPMAGGDDLAKVIREQGIKYTETAQKGIPLSGYVDSSYTQQFAGRQAVLEGSSLANGGVVSSIGATGSGGAPASNLIFGGGNLQYTGATSTDRLFTIGDAGSTVVGTGSVVGSAGGSNTYVTGGVLALTTLKNGGLSSSIVDSDEKSEAPAALARAQLADAPAQLTDRQQELKQYASDQAGGLQEAQAQAQQQAASATDALQAPTTARQALQNAQVMGPSATQELAQAQPDAAPAAAVAQLAAAAAEAAPIPSAPAPGNAPATSIASGIPAATTTPDPSRKLVRNAQLDLEVKSFPSAMDQITALTRLAGGYVDTSNSQKGGNGKLQGTVVVKVLPQNLDAFLLKLRDLGEVKNQSVGTEDVTKDYYDTQARLENSRRMETQLQQLLAHENSKVSDLLQVERELGRVRGDIEQMQGQLKLYDFQVQYATVTIQMSEKDLNQAAAYLLKETDDFSLFATNVEETFQKARQAADDFKAQVLVANLNHNSGSDISAELTVMVAPDQIEPFLAQVKALGRVDNFTRQTQRVAQDGGDSDQPADQALTEKDKVQVHLTIHSDDESRKQVALTVVTKAVDSALDQAKAAALANGGTEILSSSLNKSPQGQTTAQLSVRVPGKDYRALLDAFRALGRTASFSLQRDDNSGPGANGDDAPVIVSLALTDDDAPLQETSMVVLASDVDNQAQQLKKDAAAAGVEVKASSFARQPDGTEMAQMTFRLPMSKYPAFVESLKKLGKVQSLTVQRDDRPDQSRTDDTAPAEISLQLHNQGDVVADNNGLWATLRSTFGEGAGALFDSVRMIGVLVAFLAPWVFTLGLLAWVGRRIYLWRKK